MDDADAVLLGMSPIELVQLFLISKISDKIETNCGEVYSAFFRIIKLQIIDIHKLGKNINHSVRAIYLKLLTLECSFS